MAVKKNHGWKKDKNGEWYDPEFTEIVYGTVGILVFLFLCALLTQ